MNENTFYLYSDSKGRKLMSNNLPKILEKADEIISKEMFELSIKSGPLVRYEISTEEKNNIMLKYINSKDLNSLGSHFKPEFNCVVEHVSSL